MTEEQVWTWNLGRERMNSSRGAGMAYGGSIIIVYNTVLLQYQYQYWWGLSWVPLPRSLWIGGGQHMEPDGLKYFNVSQLGVPEVGDT